MYKYKIHLHIWAILPAALLASVLHTQHCTYTLAQIAEDHCKKKKKHIFISFFLMLRVLHIGRKKGQIPIPPPPPNTKHTHTIPSELGFRRQWWMSRPAAPCPKEKQAASPRLVIHHPCPALPCGNAQNRRALTGQNWHKTQWKTHIFFE